MKTFTFTLLLLLFSAASFSQPYEADKTYDYLVTISTDFGDIKLILFEDTPLHRENFLTLTEKKVFNGAIFHRVIKNFMIQGGDPATRNENLSEEMKKLTTSRIPAEFRPNRKHIKGAVAGARQGDQVNPYKMSSATQFYIVQNTNGTPHLNGAYSVFGQVVKGLDTVDKIAVQQTSGRDKPVNDIVMNVTFEKIKKSEITKLYNYTY